MDIQSPRLAVDIIIELENGHIVLIERKNPPHGWALPGGFVDYGESLEQAAVREALEEVQLEVELIGQLHTYSEPERDPRFHCVSTVFVGRAKGQPQAASDAQHCATFPLEALPTPLAFDHDQILKDYLEYKRKES